MFSLQHVRRVVRRRDANLAQQVLFLCFRYEIRYIVNTWKAGRHQSGQVHDVGVVGDLSYCRPQNPQHTQSAQEIPNRQSRLTVPLIRLEARLMVDEVPLPEGRMAPFMHQSIYRTVICTALLNSLIVNDGRAYPSLRGWDFVNHVHSPALWFQPSRSLPKDFEIVATGEQSQMTPCKSLTKK